MVVMTWRNRRSCNGETGGSVQLSSTLRGVRVSVGSLSPMPRPPTCRFAPVVFTGGSIPERGERKGQALSLRQWSRYLEGEPRLYERRWFRSYAAIRTNEWRSFGRNRREFGIRHTRVQRRSAFQYWQRCARGRQMFRADLQTMLTRPEREDSHPMVKAGNAVVAAVGNDFRA